MTSHMGWGLIRGLVSLVLLSLLTLAFAVETWSPRYFETSPGAARRLHTGDNYALLADKINQPRVGSIYTGLALRRASEGQLADLVAPVRLLGLATTPDYTSGDRQFSVLNGRALSNFAGGTYREVEYDPRLSRDELDSILAEGSLEQYPGDILVVVPDSEASDPRRYVLHADEGNSRVLIVPFSLSPLSEGEAAQ